ncbi:MAG: hypothetical protein JW768_03115 [Chitinispirillaceae bacterium]|nr:hypothetical protein [Chitinispirillaceae bacterium]
MGRNAKPLYKDQAGNYYARFHDGNGSFRLSLNTRDETLAMQRLPVVMSSRLSWNAYQKSTDQIGTMVVNGVDGARISPPLSYATSKETLTSLIEDSLKNGHAYYDFSRSYFIFTGLNNGISIDSTAMPGSLPPDTSYDGFLKGLEALKPTAITNNWKEIEDFYLTTMPQLYIDKKRAIRFANIWLDFLKNNGVTSWTQITEELLIKFKSWRKNTAIANGTNYKCSGKKPSNAMLNHHIKFLEKSFKKAVSMQKMRCNPIADWKPEVHITPIQHNLTLEELKKTLRRLPKAMRDIIVLLNCSCKRRKEIVSLQIENISFEEHYCHYIEYKNSAKGIPIHKSFFLTPAMERFLRRIIGNRTTGSLWDEAYNPNFISHKFEEEAYIVSPKKKATLKSLRQTCTDVMEKSGLTDLEIDACLGHVVVSKALPFYRDRSPQAVYRRLASRTQIGIEVLSRSIEEFLK